MSDPSVFTPDLSFALLAVCVAIAYTAEAATGFGSIVIALTLGAQLYPIAELLPLLVPLSVMLAAWVVARNRRFIDRSLLFGRALPRLGIGLALGFTLFATLPTSWLTPALGAFVLAVALLELRGMWTGRAAGARPLGPAGFTSATVGAGILQGAVASGGPLLVYALGRQGLSKARFRASLALVWLTLNSALVVTYVATGRLDAGTVPFVGLLVPVVAGALALGNWLHHRLDEATFRKTILGLLAVAGVALVL
ncbi:MAG: TSUP family transporter [Myxococcota bacterium]